MNHIDLINNTITLDFSSYIVLTLVMVMMTMLFLMAIYLTFRHLRLLDRYRIKYGFDRDIESKEMDNPKNMDRRETNFKRRVFKD